MRGVSTAYSSRSEFGRAGRIESDVGVIDRPDLRIGQGDLALQAGDRREQAVATLLTVGECHVADMGDSVAGPGEVGDDLDPCGGDGVGSGKPGQQRPCFGFGALQQAPGFRARCKGQRKIDGARQALHGNQFGDPDHALAVVMRQQAGKQRRECAGAENREIVAVRHRLRR